MDQTLYHVGSRTISVVHQSVTTLDDEVLVSSDDSDLSMGGGVSAAILRAGGSAIREHARKFHRAGPGVSPQAGDVVVTTAGALPARYVFHAVTIDYHAARQPDADVIGRATRNCMRLANALEVRTIAFPALGTGTGGFPFRPGADAMVRALAGCLATETTIERVRIALFARAGVTDADLNAFYEHAVGLAALWGQSRQLGDRIRDLHAQVDGPEPGLAKVLTAIGSDLHEAEMALEQTPDTVLDAQEQAEQGSLVAIADRAIRASEQSLATQTVQDPKTTVAVLRIELEAYRAQANSEQGMMTKLQNQRAMLDGAATPPALMDRVNLLATKIRATSLNIARTERRLAAAVQSGSAS